MLVLRPPATRYAQATVVDEYVDPLPVERLVTVCPTPLGTNVASLTSKSKKWSCDKNATRMFILRAYC